MKAVGATAVAYLRNIVTNVQVSSAFLGRFTVCFSVVKPRPGATAADESGVSIWSGLFNSLPHGQPSAKTKPWIIVQMSKLSRRGRSCSGWSSAVSRARLTDPFPQQQPSGWISPGAAVELEAAHYRSPAELFREAAESAGTLRFPQQFAPASVLRLIGGRACRGLLASTRVHILGYVASRPARVQCQGLHSALRRIKSNSVPRTWCTS